MNFEKGHVYHVFNRGNNGEKLFYNHANYKFFIEKIDYHILPFADLLAWCLMPNHFHMMINVNREMIFSISLNQSIGKMLSSYARAINVQERRTGSLFQQHSKALCLNQNAKLTPSWQKTFGVSKINSWNEKSDYPKICMDYIHLNPVNAGIVINIEDWKWSSYHEIYGLSANLELVNIDKLKLVVSL